MRAGCGLAEPGLTRTTRGERRSRRRWVRGRGMELTGGDRGQRCSRLRAVGGADRAGAAGSFVCAVHPAGPFRFGACSPLSHPGPGSAALAGPRNPFSAQPAGVRLSSLSCPRPNLIPTDRRLSFPGRLLPLVIRSQDGFPLAGSLLTLQFAESEGAPVVAAGRVVP